MWPSGRGSGKHDQRRPAGGGVFGSFHMQSGVLELGPRIERMQTGPGRQKPEQPPRDRRSVIDCDCHDTAAATQNARGCLQDSRTVRFAQQVKQITHKHNVIKRQLSCITHDNLTRARQVANSQEHCSRPI
jgi:hypothetical protein